MEEVAASRPALPLMFYLICAEACAKLARSFDGEGESRRHVRIFFEEYCADEHRRQLMEGFRRTEMNDPLSVREIVDILYLVRCDVVHEGLYYMFSMPSSYAAVPLANSVGDTDFTVRMPLSSIRQIVLEGAVHAIRTVLTPEQRTAAGLAAERAITRR